MDSGRTSCFKTSFQCHLFGRIDFLLNVMASGLELYFVPQVTKATGLTRTRNGLIDCRWPFCFIARRLIIIMNFSSIFLLFN